MPDETHDVIARRAASLIADHRDLLKGLVATRTSHGLSQATVAERMGVSQPTVAGFERYDANPTLSTVRRYALAVGVRIATQVFDDTAGDETTCAELEEIVHGPVRFAPRVDRAPSVDWSRPTMMVRADA